MRVLTQERTEQKQTKAASLPLTLHGVAGLLKACGDPLRLDILRVLKNDTFGVSELAQIFDMPQPGMTHHLKLLAKSQVLATRRQGNSIFYRRPLTVGDSPGEGLLQQLFSTIDELEVSPELRRKIELVHIERSKRSRDFFEKHFQDVSDNQAQLCDQSHYVANLGELLDATGVDKQSSALEVGPGTGLFLEELARRFDKVVALDQSKKMLGLAKENLAKTSTGILFLEESLESFQPENPFDVIALNMVLHHMPSPPKTFELLASMIAKGGYLIIADLCTHDQQWTKETCGDLWQGFDPSDLDAWAKNAGFIEKQSLYLGLKNGFQIQLKLFTTLSSHPSFERRK